MLETMLPRRRFLGAAGVVSGTLFPAMLRAQSAGLPNLTIKDVKVYVTASGRLASITTEGGVEGICTLQTRVFHANWDNSAWLDYAKRTLAGKNALDHLQFTSQYSPVRRHYGQAPPIPCVSWSITSAVSLPA